LLLQTEIPDERKHLPLFFRQFFDRDVELLPPLDRHDSVIAGICRVVDDVHRAVQPLHHVRPVVGRVAHRP
jgi:hypothetical protein